MIRAPWRWRWGAILGLTLLWSVIGAAVGYSPVLGIVVAIWLVLWLRAACNQPRSPGVGVAPLEGKEAAHRVVELGNGGGRIVYVKAEYNHTRVQG